MTSSPSAQSSNFLSRPVRSSLTFTLTGSDGAQMTRPHHLSPRLNALTLYTYAQHSAWSLNTSACRYTCEKWLTLSLIVGWTLALSACQAPSSDPSNQAPQENRSRENLYADRTPIVASVGDSVITEADISRRLEGLSPVSRARYQTPERRQELISSLIRFELLAQEARRRGHHQHPDVELAYKQAMVRELLGKEVRNLVKMSEISDEDTRTYYDEHLDDYQRPELVRAAHLLFPSQAAALATLKEYQLRLKAKPKEARVIFGDLAAKRSHDQETKARRGDLQYFIETGRGYGERRFPQSPVPLEVARAAFALKRVGEVTSKPIKSEKGWHLVQRTGGKRAFKRPLSEVRTEIRNTLFRVRKGKALEAYVKQLKSQVTITIDEEKLNALKLPPGSAHSKRTPKRTARSLPLNFPGARPKSSAQP